MATVDQSMELTMAQMVNRYFTPLAVLLVAMGIVLSQPMSPTREICIGLLVFSLAFNFGSVGWIRGNPKKREFRLKLRVVLNIAVNTLLVFFLGGYWHPMWLLMLLSPVATAMYGSRRRTLGAALLVSAILLVIHATRGMNSPLEWGVQSIQVIFIILVSLLVHDLAQVAKRS